ncbi:MAG: DUF1570 domain-containing protein [Planctomycetes bacterium]|nr:DUF1570 domain-containing protein [Planctomycetota bacterium]
MAALPLVAQDEAAFDAGIEDVHAQMAKGRWDQALAGLDALLEQHAGKVYVQAQQDAFVHDYETCCFNKDAGRPALQELITGKVVTFNERSGKLKLHYSIDFRDWQGEGDVIVHPATFAGPYSMTIEGPSYYEDSKTQGMFFDLSPSAEDYWYADFGLAPSSQGRVVTSAPCRVSRLSSAREYAIGRDKSPVKPGKKFQLTVKVAEKQVELIYNRKRVLRVKRDETALGQLGLWSTQKDLDVTIEGKVEPSFYQGLVDAWLAERKQVFDKAFDARKVLPKWLFERPELERTPANDDLWLPGSDEGVSADAEKVLKGWAEGDLRGALEALRKLTDDDARPVTRAYLEASLLLQLGDAEAALASCDRIAAADRSCLTMLLRGEVLDQLGRSDEALTARQQALADDPGRVKAYQDTVVALLKQERHDEAARLVRKGKVEHGLWDELKDLDKLLAMVERGPLFPRAYRATSKHYEVVSDIDRRVCAEACQLLEQSYVSLRVRLGSLRGKHEQRFRVFLFSGEDGYQAYCKDILGSAVPHTAGLYSPVLKQLLIWNLPKREDMDRTIRHEGFHQFLDRVMKNPPVWLNEGTAEYWETARRENGSLTGGQVRKDHIATLIRSRNMLPSLRDFVYGGRGDFYANAQQRYAQGWALVHFLREGGRDNEKRFETLWAALRKEGSTRSALDEAFRGVDWQAFEERFWQHLRGLD